VAALQARLQQALDLAQALEALRREQSATLAALQRASRRGRWR
jgi:hypothetical protein